MGKYGILASYLSEEQLDLKIMSFKEIEKILCFVLPRSARKYRAWWANDKSHIQAFEGWMSVGWGIESINLQEETVTFKKVSKSKADKTKSFQPNIISEEKKITPQAFESLARAKMSDFFHKELNPRRLLEYPKVFDLVSEDKEIVGDAKYFSMVKGERLPPAKFSVIAEHVWMLEKTKAKIKFLVFGNDKRVPEEWLRRYSRFVNDVQFYFLQGDNVLKMR